MLAIVALFGIGLIGSVLVETIGETSDREGEGDLNLDIGDSNEDGGRSDMLQHIDGSEVVDEGQIEALANEYEIDQEFLADQNLLVGGEADDFLDGDVWANGQTFDHIFGGGGNDVLVGGEGDVLIGGDGNDSFSLRHGTEVHILDFSDDDILVVKYEGREPKITGDATDDGISIFADGHIIANLDGVYEFDFSRISFVRET